MEWFERDLRLIRAQFVLGRFQSHPSVGSANTNGPNTPGRRTIEYSVSSFVS